MDQPVVRAFNAMRDICKTVGYMGPEYIRGDYIAYLVGSPFTALYKGIITEETLGRLQEIIRTEQVGNRMRIKTAYQAIEIQYIGMTATQESVTPNKENAIEVAEKITGISTGEADVMLGIVEGRPAISLKLPTNDRFVMLMDIKQAEGIHAALGDIIRKAKEGK